MVAMATGVVSIGGKFK